MIHLSAKARKNGLDRVLLQSKLSKNGRLDTVVVTEERALHLCIRCRSRLNTLTDTTERVSLQDVGDAGLQALCATDRGNANGRKRVQADVEDARVGSDIVNGNTSGLGKDFLNKALVSRDARRLTLLNLGALHLLQRKSKRQLSQAIGNDGRASGRVLNNILEHGTEKLKGFVELGLR